LESLAGAVGNFAQQAVRELGGSTSSQLTYTHSALARQSRVVAMALFVLAILVEGYVLVVTEWRDFTSLPMNLAIPTFGLTLVPASVIALTGLFLLLASHAVEYLARIAAQVARGANTES
jgi:hypothetical protein